MLLPLIAAGVVLVALLTILAMARVSAGADRVAREERANLEGEVRATDRRRAAG